MKRYTHVVRRGDFYRFRVRVPADLRERMKRVEISRSLRTTSRIEASLIAGLLYLRTEQLWLRIRAAMTGAEIERLVDEWIREELVRDTRVRADLSFAEPFARPGERLNEVAAALWRQEADQSLEQWQERIQESDWVAAEPLANLFIKERGLSIAKGSEHYKQLCLALTFASVRVAQVRLDRSEGRWTDEPRFGSSNGAALCETPSPAATVPAAPPGKTLRALAAEFVEEKRRFRKYNPKRLMDFETALRTFRKFIGDDHPINHITKKDVGEFRQLLTQLPPSFTKRFPGLKLQEIAARAREAKLAPLEAQTINTKYLVVLGHFFGWCRQCAHIDENPAAGIRVDQPKGSTEKRRHPFKLEYLKLLFQAPLYRGCESANYIYAPGKHLVRDHRYWLPILGLFTGARLGELCQLHLDDVKEVEGVWCIDITPEDGRRLKTKAARRTVPVHPELVRLGFIAHVESLRGGSQKRLFPEVVEGAGGYVSENASKWFARFLRKTLGKETTEAAGLAFHSFRHTMKDALRVAGVHERVQDALLGHESGHVSGGYGDGYKPPRLLEEIAKVGYAGLDLSHLERRDTH